MIIYGINPVLEALRTGRVRRVRVGPRGDRRVEEALALARAGDRHRARRRANVEQAARGGVHQGIVAELAPREITVCASSSTGRRQPRRSSSCSTGSKIRTTSARSCGRRRRRRARRGSAGPARGTARWHCREGVGGAVTHVRIATEVNVAGHRSVGRRECVDGRPRRRRRRAVRRGGFDLPTALVFGAERYRPAAAGT